MNTGKKVLNIFGIIFAWILSFVLILFLIASPLIFSTLSLFKPQNLSETIKNIDYSKVAPSLMPDEEDGAVGADSEKIEALLSSKAAKEMYEIYAKNFVNSLSGKTVEVELDAEKIKEIVDKNIDEIAEILRESNPVYADVSEDELKSGIKTLVDQSAEEIANILPEPQKIKEEMADKNPTIALGLDIVSKSNTIIFSLVGAIVLISALIFVCRLYGFRGFRWLSVDLFVASLFLVVIFVMLSVSSAVVQGLLGSGEWASVITNSFISSLKLGMIIRTTIMFVSAVALLIVYLLIKRAKNRKVLAAVFGTATAGAPAVEGAPAAEEAAASNEEPMQ